MPPLKPSTLTSVAPATVGRTLRACSIPGRRTSWVNSRLAVTILAISGRCGVVLRLVFNGRCIGKLEIELMIANQLGVGHRLRAAWSADHAVFHRQALHRNVEFGGGHLEQRLSRRRTGLPERTVHRGNAV